MRICHVMTRFIRGGADENTAQTCNGQATAGHDVHLIVGREVDPKQLESLLPEVKVWRVLMLVREVSPICDIAAVFRLVFLIRKIRPEIVHTHASKAGILGRMAAYVVRVPTIIHGVHILPFINVSWSQSLVYRALERLAALVTDVFINVGKEMRDECIRAGIGTADRHVVIASGMDLRKFSRDLREKVRWQEVLRGYEFRLAAPRFVLLASRLEARKGQFEFLSAFAEIARVFPEVMLIIAGEGPDHARIAERISSLGIGERVIMTGFRKDIERLMAIADIGLLTSRREGMPRVLVQYALMRLPIVATDIPGSREIVTHGINGFLVPPRDLEAMQESLSQLLRDPEKCREFSQAQDRLNLSKWSIEGMNEQIEQVYRIVQQNRLAQMNSDTR